MTAENLVDLGFFLASVFLAQAALVVTFFLWRLLRTRFSSEPSYRNAHQQHWPASNALITTAFIMLILSFAGAVWVTATMLDSDRKGVSTSLIQLSKAAGEAAIDIGSKASSDSGAE